MPNNYVLVNPYITGKVNKSYTGTSELDAAKEAYDTMSQYFNNNIPKFYFTLQKVKNNEAIGGGKNSEYYHFKVTESKKGSQVEYGITPFKVTGNSNQMKKFRDEIGKNTNSQEGGKKKHKYNDNDDDSSDSDWLGDDSSDYIYRSKFLRSHSLISQPISSWFYDPYLYRIQKFYIPTFVAPLTPYIQIPLWI